MWDRDRMKPIEVFISYQELWLEYLISWDIKPPQAWKKEVTSFYSYCVPTNHPYLVHSGPGETVPDWTVTISRMQFLGDNGKGTVVDYSYLQ